MHSNQHCIVCCNLMHISFKDIYFELLLKLYIVVCVAASLICYSD